MKKRLQFKLMATLILFSLVALETLQVFWLKNLYDTIREQTIIQLQEAIKLADYKELFIRLDEIKREFKEKESQKENPEKFRHSIDINIADSLRSKPNLPGESNTVRIYIREENDEEDKDEKDIIDMLPQYLSLIKGLEAQIISAIHASTDTLRPVNYNIFIQSLEEELKKQDIHVPARLDFFSRKDSLLCTTFINNPHQKEIKENNQNLVIKYNFSEEENYYILTLQKPQYIILWRMAGILSTSAILSLLVIGVFIYLFRTIVRQKTEEELKTDFTNNVTHELKTPVAVARAANDALLNYDDKVTEKQKKYLGIIEDQLARLTGMIEQILSLSAENRSTFKLNIQPIHVEEIVYPVIEQQKLKTKKQVNILCDLPDHLVIKADKAHFTHMVTNLLDNAIKYTEKENVQLHITGKQEKDYTIFSVADQGKGIPEEHQKRIFDKFYRVPQGNLHNVKGYGLGLYYIADTMKRHNGSVSVTSRPGEGTVFTLTFRNS
ncbi:MAG: HAMP domain-containing histidine kinase [Tannerellaceae bacterium]|nr:HAMP domain-containing histidine kinase [Tannerellaceae bacterium]